jgi:hypothetical protein
MRYMLRGAVLLFCLGFFSPVRAQGVNPDVANIIRQQPQVLQMSGYVLNQALREQTLGRLNPLLPPGNEAIDDGPVIRYENMRPLLPPVQGLPPTRR